MDDLEIFQFKNFIVAQNGQLVFKVNTDAVLLASWIDIENPINILEIGSGTGVISLCLADKYNTYCPPIIAIDIDINAYTLSKYNFKKSHFKNLISIHQSLKEFNEHSNELFDLIVSNPPYHTEQFFSTKDRNIKAKYTESLTFLDLISISSKKLNATGNFFIIIPISQFDTIEKLALKEGLYIIKFCKIYPKKTKLVNRVLLKLSLLKPINTEEESLIIYNEDNTYTKEYKKLTSRYYIKF